MSTSTHERLSELEAELLGLVNVSSPTAAMRDRIHFLVTIAARVVHAACLLHLGVGSKVRFEESTDVSDLSYCRRLAAQAYPLPPKRVLREEPDPNGCPMRWRWADTGLQYQWAGVRGWTAVAPSDLWAPTSERIDLWHSLKHEPHREVPDNGDE